jgi:glycosyltransferase involved in cell wall biosynthesis
LGHEDDIVVCGCANTAKRYQQVLGIQTLALPTFGISEEFYPMDPKWCRKKLQQPLDEKILLFTGRFAKDKSIPQLIRVYQQISESKPVRLVLILSSVDTHLWKQTKDLLDGVHIIHDATPDELRLWYNAADVFTFPGCSIFETWGRSPMEAIACHTPVVLADWCGFREYVSENNGRLCTVQYASEPVVSPFHYAGVDDNEYRNLLEKSLSSPSSKVGILPEWAHHSFCVEALRIFVDSTYLTSNVRFVHENISAQIDKASYSNTVQLLWDYFHMNTIEDIFRRDTSLSWLNRRHRGSDELISSLFHMMYR